MLICYKEVMAESSYRRLWGESCWVLICTNISMWLSPSHEKQMESRINTSVNVLKQGTARVFPSHKTNWICHKVGSSNAKFINFLWKVIPFYRNYPLSKSIKNLPLGIPNSVPMCHYQTCSQSIRKMDLSPAVTIQFLTWGERKRSQNSSPHWNHHMLEWHGPSCMC